MKKYIIAVAVFISTAVSVSAQSKKNAQVAKLYTNYLAVKTALASDNAAATAKAATEFSRTAAALDKKAIPENRLNTLKKEAAAISGNQNISAQRKSFYSLSDAMIALTNEFKISENPVYVQYCPMADGSWLSSEKKIVNPYYGSAMLSCGNIKAEIK